MYDMFYYVSLLNQHTYYKSKTSLKNLLELTQKVFYIVIQNKKIEIYLTIS